MGGYVNGETHLAQSFQAEAKLSLDENVAGSTDELDANILAAVRRLHTL